MNPKIAFLGIPHYCDYIKNLMQYYHFDFSNICILDFYEYNTISDFETLYRSVYSQYDGFCVIGSMNLKLINSFTDLLPKPVQAVKSRSLEYFKALFLLLNKDRSIDFRRVIADFSLWFDTPVSLQIPETAEDFIHTDQLFTDTQKKLLDLITPENVAQTEINIITNARKLIQEDKADHILCRFPTAYLTLLDEGIPCSFVYPASETIIDTIHLLINDIRLSQMDADLPAILHITCDEIPVSELTGITSNSLILQQSLLEFDQSRTAGFVIRQTIQGYEIFTTQQVVRNITDNFTNCQLKNFIFSRTGLNIQIGYGIGSNVMKAKKNAAAASKIAQRNKSSYIITPNEALIGPLDASSQNVEAQKVNPLLLDVAKTSSLSLSTIQRILSVTEMLGTKELTTLDLASSLQVTSANANRFLNALLKSGYAEIISEKKSYSKGRPSRIYKILF